MGVDTAIEWTEATWNPIVGCTVLSPGCKRCYAMRMAARLERMGMPHYAGLTELTKAGAVWTGKLALAPDSILLAPLRRRKATTYFVNSMGDLFHEDVPDEWIDRVFAVMALCPQHTFQVLTKRSARMHAYMTRPSGGGKPNALNRVAWDATIEVMNSIAPGWKDEPVDGKWRSRAIKVGGAWPLPNVWLGVSAEDQRRADERVLHLLATPAAVRFVSAEPLLGPVNFSWIQTIGGGELSALTGRWATCPIIRSGERLLITVARTPRLDWIIVGGESGPGARTMDPNWARSIRDQCAAAGVAFFMKQMSGAVKARMPEIPPDLLIRQMPLAVASSPAMEAEHVG